MEVKVERLLNELDNYTYQQYNQREIERIEKELDKIRKSYGKQNYGDSSYISYPQLTDSFFSQKLYQKKEFNKYKYDSVDKNIPFDQLVSDKCNQSMFNLTKNQVFLKNFLSPYTPYNGILLFHGVGVGKSCTALSIAEQFRDVFSKKTLIMMPTNLKDNFKRQIFDITKINQCTGAKYFKEATDGANDLASTILATDAIEKRVNKLINNRYKFMGFQEFANYVIKLQNNIRDDGQKMIKWIAKIREIFSNRVIIIDEVHNVREGEGSSKIVPPKLMEVVKYAENVKLVLLTATPMFNEASEIVWLANMLLANDKRPLLHASDVFDESGDVSEKGRATLQAALNGYVSYMRGENPFAFPMRLSPSKNSDPSILQAKEVPKKDIKGVNIPKELRLNRLELIKGYMSDYQSSLYLKAETFVADVDKDADDLDDEEESSHRVSNATILQISNIVYPSLKKLKDTEYREYYGLRGFQKCFDERKNKTFNVSYKPEIVAKYGEFLSLSKIEHFSPKMKSILEYIKTSTGIVYVYSFFLHSGVLPLAIALEHMGFAKYNNNNILVNSTKAKPFLINGKQATYSLITPKTKTQFTPDFDGEIEAIRSDANKEGEIVKVILGSSVSAEGIDFKRIRQVHLLEPWYHLNKIEQIVGRAVRNCSHIDLRKEHRNVTVYHHVNMIEKRKNETIDLRNYRIAENKQITIDKIEFIMKETAMDCHLNENAIYFDPSKLKMKQDVITSQNVKLKSFPIGDTVDSRFTAFKCNAKVDKTAKVDESTFRKEFYTDDIELYTNYIADVFMSTHALTYTELLTVLKREYKLIDEDIYRFAIDAMLTTRQRVTNMNGIDGFLIYKGKYYMFQPLFTKDEKLPLHVRKQYQRDKVYKLVLDADDHTNGATIVGGDIMQLIEERVNAIINSEMAGETTFQPAVVDYVIDRLSATELNALMIAVHNKNSKSALLVEVRRSCIDAGILAIEPWFRSPHSKEWYVVKDGKVMQAMYEFRQIADKLAPYIIENSVEPGSNFKKFTGYVDIIADGTTVFKMIDQSKEKSNGYVCAKTSTLKIGDLKKIISDLNKSKPLLEHKKPALCSIYEILLRAQGDKRIARPLESYAINSKQYKGKN